MENNRLPDTPWHVGYTKKEDSDPRRHKARCVYFKDGKCTCRYNRCYALQCAGSAQFSTFLRISIAFNIR